MKAAIVWRWHMLHTGARATESVEFSFAPSLASLLPFAAPDKGRGVLLPVCGHSY